MIAETPSVTQLSQVIAQVTAPSFLLGAVAAFTSVLIARMNRIIDRSQALNAIGDDEIATYIPHSRRARLCAPPAGGLATYLDRRRRSLLRATEGFATAPALGGRQIA